MSVHCAARLFLYSIFLVFPWCFAVAESQDVSCQIRVKTDLSVTELMNHLNCKPVPVGESVVVHDEAAENSPTNVPRNYILRKKDAKTFQVVINPKFYSGGLSQVLDTFSSEESAAAKKMRAKVQGCLAEANSHFLGPNGEKFEMILAPPDSKNPEEKKIEAPVKILSAKERSHSKGYAENIDCPAIVHESLHLTGLADEYVELAGGAKCRIDGSPSSIMGGALTLSDSLKSFEKRQLYSMVSGELCVCISPELCSGKESSSRCDEPGFAKRFHSIHMAVNNGDQPDPTSSLKRSVVAMNMSVGMGMTPNANSMAKTSPKILNMKVVNYDSVPKESYLLPAHFRFITEPNCRASNKMYTNCGKQIWRVLDFTACPEMPDYCKNGEWQK
jgi:hypothetical protein